MDLHLLFRLGARSNGLFQKLIPSRSHSVYRHANLPSLARFLLHDGAGWRNLDRLLHNLLNLVDCRGSRREIILIRNSHSDLQLLDVIG